MFRKVSVLVGVIALLMTFATASFAQIQSGRVVGNVLDANGEAVPNANVTLRNTATGQTLEAQTTGEGSYSFPNVSVGEYEITFAATGFSPATQNLQVVLNQESTVDAALQVSGVGATNVEVTAASEALIQTESSQLGKNFETRQVLDLPIFGNQNALALLSPNVVQQGAGVAGTGGSVGGTRARANNFIIDGVDNNDPSVTGPQTTVIQDAVSEFSLLTNVFSAEFGTGAGGQFVTITKSGTNEFSGSGFLYTQNQALNAASTTEEAQLVRGDINEKPRFRDTRFGATVGGPIVRNKLFFFVAGQRQLQNLESPSTSFLSPTPAGLATLNALAANSAVRNVLSFISPASTAEDFVTVNGQNIPVGLVALNIPAGFTDNQFQTNVDYNPNSVDQFRFRFSYDSLQATQAGNGNVRFNNLFAFDSRLFSANYVRTFSSNLVNDLRLSYRRAIEDFPLQDQSLSNTPNFFIADLGLDLGPNGNLPQGGSTNSYQVFDAATYVSGRNTFKFGGEYRRLLSNSIFLPRGRGDFLYGSLEELVNDELPSFDAIRGVGSGGFTGNQHKFYAFGQDDFKVTPNLTLNLGLRYEYVTVPRDLSLQALNAISNVPGVIEFGAPEADRNNFGPRVGFAYSPGFEEGVGGLVFGGRGTSSIRGGFTIAYSENFQNLALLSLPPQFQQELRAGNVAGFNTGPGFLARGGLPSFPIFPSSAAAARNVTGSLSPDDVQPYTMSFQLSFQREITPSTAVEVRYLGTRTRKLPIQTRLNGGVVPDSRLNLPTFIIAPTAAQLSGSASVLAAGQTLPAANLAVGSLALSQSGFNSPVTSFANVGNAQYDGASVSLNRRFSRGLGFTAAYTFSKAIDDATNEVFSNLVNPRRPQDFFNLRNERAISANDVPHRFAASLNYTVPRFTENGFVNFFVRGLSANFIYQAQSGQPFTPQSGADSNLNGDTAGDRTLLNPNGVENTGTAVFPVDVNGVRVINANGSFASVASRNPRTAGYVTINPNAQYIQAGPGVRATAGRNTARSNGFNRTDATFLKNFVFGEERYTFQVGAETFNLFNQRIRTLGGFAPTSNSFARVDAGSLFNNYDAGEFAGRTIQIRAKFLF